MSDDKLLLSTSRFQVVERSYATATGQHTRAIIQHPGAVCILPLFDDGRVVLIRNRRVAVDRDLLEIPAGTREPGEAPQMTAVRELEEETGYRANTFTPLHEFWMSPGILHERMHLFVARGLTLSRQSLDEGEVIQPLVFQWAEVLAMVESGQIEDAKTLVAILWYERFRRVA